MSPADRQSAKSWNTARSLGRPRRASAIGCRNQLGSAWGHSAVIRQRVSIRIDNPVRRRGWHEGAPGLDDHGSRKGILRCPCIAHRQGHPMKHDTTIPRRGFLVAAAAVALLVASGCTMSTPSVIATSHRATAVNPSPSQMSAPLLSAKDLGPREGADGEATPGKDGVFEYVVASGDTETGIASRFRICVGDVQSSTGDLSIFAGDRISLEKTTGVPLGSSKCVQPGG